MSSGIAGIVLAAGLGRRFGGNKLEAEYGGRKLYQRALDVLDLSRFSSVSVVSGKDEILNYARQRGFIPTKNNHPEDGISLSIRLGLESVGSCSGALFLVADQPLLSRQSVDKIIDTAQEHPGFIIVPVSENGESGNPCFFPDAFFPELKNLSGDTGGKKVILSHSEKVVTVPLPSNELLDFDTKEELARLVIV